jgi:hypothetical protein
MGHCGTDELKQLDSLLALGKQSWLLGAGIGLHSNIPLMRTLTSRVFELVQDGPERDLLNVIAAELPEDAHIEHILSQIGDYTTIAERSGKTEVNVEGNVFDLDVVKKSHTLILEAIVNTIRWGYRPGTNNDALTIGTRDKPLVTVTAHVEFINALLQFGQAGVVERRHPIRFFTTNYDTLLEDALALGCFPYWDGFSGGGLAFRSHHYGQEEPNMGYRAHVIKLHGSIDWHLGDDGKVWRVRDGDNYPEKSKRVLIYPQLTKYLATQRDPFSAQFDLFRRALSENGENILAICGYSFGDEHINQEIELAIQCPGNKTTVIAFAATVGGVLDKWRHSHWGKRLYIAAQDGLYIGAEGPLCVPERGKQMDWWTFDGVTRLLNNGAGVNSQ